MMGKDHVDRVQGGNLVDADGGKIGSVGNVCVKRPDWRTAVGDGQHRAVWHLAVDCPARRGHPGG